MYLEIGHYWIPHTWITNITIQTMKVNYYIHVSLTANTFTVWKGCVGGVSWEGGGLGGLSLNTDQENLGQRRPKYISGTRCSFQYREIQHDHTHRFLAQD